FLTSRHVSNVFSKFGSSSFTSRWVMRCLFHSAMMSALRSRFSVGVSRRTFFPGERKDLELQSMQAPNRVSANRPVTDVSSSQASQSDQSSSRDRRNGRKLSQSLQ